MKPKLDVSYSHQFSFRNLIINPLSAPPQLLSAREQLSLCLSRWDAYETSQEEFTAWLTDANRYLTAELELKATLGEKAELLDLYTVRGLILLLDGMDMVQNVK